MESMLSNMKTSNLPFFELYVKHHECLTNEYSKLGVHEAGSLSVRKKEGEKPIIIFCQDECMFEQYLLTLKYWALPDGAILPIPKRRGPGYHTFIFL